MRGAGLADGKPALVREKPSDLLRFGVSLLAVPAAQRRAGFAEMGRSLALQRGRAQCPCTCLAANSGKFRLQLGIHCLPEKSGKRSTG